MERRRWCGSVIHRRPIPSDAKSADAAAPEVGLRYIETATIGEGKRVYAPRCVITPNGDMALKSRTDEQSLPLTVDILEPDTGEALVIYGTE